MLAVPLLTTKLYIPPPLPNPVKRPRLVKRLDEGLRLGHRMTLVSAPAGFGKTTLVSEWIHSGVSSREYGVWGEHQLACEGSVTPYSILPIPRFAWLSLDESDNDPARFLTYFIAALQTIAENVGKGVLSALQSPQPPPTEAVLISLINEIAALPDHPAAGSGQGIVLVLDDYHLIEAQPIHNALSFLLEHLAPHMHLVIATREDPHLPLARLRARGRLTELRATDLRFTSSEAAEFLNRVMGLELTAEDIAALETRTEGWIAGLQLAAISMRGRKDVTGFIRSFTGGHRFVLDFLVEEVLEQQPESVQTFLLQTAILDRLAGSLCDALTGHDNGQTTLETLEHANLFIVPLDEERRWYRYHHLFADLLRQRLNQTQSEQLPILHHRASEWYQQNGVVDAAIEHSLRGERFERAAVLMDEQADVVWGRGEHTKLYRWLGRLPNEILLANPQLCIFQACYQLTSGQQDAAEQSLLAAEDALSQRIELATETAPMEHDPTNESSRMKIRGRAAAIRAELAFYRGDVQGINRYSRQALKLLPEQDLTWRSTATVALGDAYSFMGDIEEAYRVRSEAVELSQAGGNVYMILLSSLKLAVTLRQLGRLSQVIEMCQQRLQLADESGMSQSDVTGCSLAIWGEVLAEIDDLDGAIDLVRKGVELAERGGDVAMIGWSYVCLTRVLFSRGDTAGAEEIIQKIVKISRESDVPPWMTNQVLVWQPRIWLTQDKLEAAYQWAGERGLDADGDLLFLREAEYIVLSRILLAEGKREQATRLLQRLLEAAEVGEHISRMIEILILQALVFQAGGDPSQAMTALKRALTLAEPGGFIRIFVDEGPPMARLLYEAAIRGIAPGYTRRLLSAFPVAEPEKTAPSKTQAPKSDLIEPLSEREIQVLQLVAAGLTNPEIAARLFLSLNTVKVHTRNIYGKLGVHNRTEAVAKGRAVGVLAST